MIDAPPPPLWVQLAGPVLAFFAALLGAWLGARFAVDRFRKERQFDRRADWYERVFEAQTTLLATLREVQLLTRDEPIAASRVTNLSNAFDKFDGPMVLSRGLLFASHNVRAAFEEFSKALSAMPRLSQAELANPSFAAQLKVAIESGVRAQRVMADEYRKHMGIEPYDWNLDE